MKKSHIILKQVGQLVYLCHYSLTHAIRWGFFGGVCILSSLRGSTRESECSACFPPCRSSHPTIALWRVRVDEWYFPGSSFKTRWWLCGLRVRVIRNLFLHPHDVSIEQFSGENTVLWSRVVFGYVPEGIFSSNPSEYKISPLCHHTWSDPRLNGIYQRTIAQEDDTTKYS